MSESIELSGRLSGPEPVTGYLSGAGYALEGFLTLAGDSVLKGTLTVPDGGSSLPHWDGDYTVESPANEDLVLETRDHIMDDDFTVKKIRYEETSNPAGGITITIAG